MKKIIKKLYRIIPFKKEMFTILKTFWVPGKNVTQHLHFESVINIKADSSRFLINHYGYMIENELFWYGLEGAWEKASFKLWKELSKKANVIFDVGANTGVYTLIAEALNPKADVYAFEPINSVYKKLQDNIYLNSFKANAYELALSNFTGEATIYLEKNATHSLSVAVNKSLLGEGVESRVEKIRTIRIDEFIENHDIQKIDLMKIDVETHEPEVLMGMGQYVKKFKPTLLIEILNDEIGQRVEEIIEGLGYLYFNIDEDSGIITQTTSIKQSSYFNYLICDESTARFLKLVV